MTPPDVTPIYFILLDIKSHFCGDSNLYQNTANGKYIMARMVNFKSLHLTKDNSSKIYSNTVFYYLLWLFIFCGA